MLFRSYEKAQKLLSCFSDQNPDKKRKQAALYEKTGETDKAYQTYEEILFSGYQMLSLVFNNLFAMEKTNGNMQKSKYYAEKRKDLVRLFEMGDYNISAVDLELLQLEKAPVDLSRQQPLSSMSALSCSQACMASGERPRVERSMSMNTGVADRKSVV